MQGVVCTHYELVPGEEDAVNGARDVDGALALWGGRVGVREVNAGPRAPHDHLDVGAVTPDHELVVLGGDLQLH